MCHPGYKKEDVSVAESPIAGYFGTGSRVTTSAYSVPLKHGIPIEFDKEQNKDGHNNCFHLCDREWSVNDSNRFQKLVHQNYGYRLYLDDLPSATKYAG